MAEPKIRAEIPIQETWDVESVYTNPEAFEADFHRLGELIEPIMAYQGKLDSASAVAEVFRLEDEMGQTLERLYLYAHMLEDQDTTVGENQARMSRIQSQVAQIRGQLAWIEPEILAHDAQTLESWSQDPALEPYRRTMTILLRQKPHILSVGEETILGLASDPLSTPAQAFGKLTNADLTFDDAQDSKGKRHTVTNGSYLTLMLDRDRTLRENAFRSLYKGYDNHKNTLSTLLSGNIKVHVLNASVRKFSSALEASLFTDNIPTDVYHSLIEAVSDALPTYHRYLDLRKRKLGLDDMNVWDMHVPLVPDYEVNMTWPETRRRILEALEPMGEEYRGVAAGSFDERWYDIWENKGKRSGAYSTGAYGCKPFMLLNYHGTLEDTFTVAHELGHSMHTWMSHRNQPYRYGDYPIFLAEIASTTCEALLHHHLMATSDDPRFQAYLLTHLCDQFRGTLFRQTMFAEFELEIHRRAEAGEPVTAEALSEFYYDLNAKYHGAAFEADKTIALEWMRIPHFYYNFYVYKYATGFAAAQIFARRILDGSGNGDRERYLGFLKSGSSKDPLDTVRDAGVDLAKPDVVRQSFKTFDEAIEQLDALI